MNEETHDGALLGERALSQLPRRFARRWRCCASRRKPGKRQRRNAAASRRCAVQEASPAPIGRRALAATLPPRLLSIGLSANGGGGASRRSSPDSRGNTPRRHTQAAVRSSRAADHKRRAAAVRSRRAAAASTPDRPERWARQSRYRPRRALVPSRQTPGSMLQRQPMKRAFSYCSSGECSGAPPKRLGGTACNLRFKCIQKAPPGGRAFVANCNASTDSQPSKSRPAKLDAARTRRFYRCAVISARAVGNV